ncbi:MAG: hypothetical protein HYX69_01010 [Planctomycetia bacterium]|nr:hypothetical protein [Planctomycetia bacterium]
MSDAKNVPQTVPAEYGGKWLAWTKDAMRIVGVGDTPDDARLAAEKAGVTEIVYEWVPPSEERLVLISRGPAGEVSYLRRSRAAVVTVTM